MGYLLGMMIALLILYAQSQLVIAVGDDARIGILALRVDAVHVRDLCAVGHRQSYEN